MISLFLSCYIADNNCLDERPGPSLDASYGGGINSGQFSVPHVSIVHTFSPPNKAMMSCMKPRPHCIHIGI